MDRLLRDIARSPDDDGPRLVWADREGGERGELVVLQCRIAAREGTKRERAKLQARVRDLLPKFQPDGQRFVRGFAEYAEVETDAISPELFDEQPGLRALKLASYPLTARPTSYGLGTPRQRWEEEAIRLVAALGRVPRGRLRSLCVSPVVEEKGDHIEPDADHAFGDAFVELVAGIPNLAGLRDLRVLAGKLSVASAPHFARLGITSLRGGVDLRGEDFATLFAAAPALERFGGWHSESPLRGKHLSDLLALPATRGLRGFDVWANDLGDEDLARIAEVPFTRLESLGIGWASYTVEAIAALAASPHLASITELDVYSPEDDLPSMLAFLRPPFEIRRLRLGHVDRDAVAALVHAPALEELYVTPPDKPDYDRLRAAIPLVNDGGTW